MILVTLGNQKSFKKCYFEKNTFDNIQENKGCSIHVLSPEIKIEPLKKIIYVHKYHYFLFREITSFS